MSGERGPLVLGAGGRVGTMFRRLAAQGLWPGAEPVWHTRDGREGTLGWDMGAGPRPDRSALHGVRGIIVLAGVTAGQAGHSASQTEDRLIEGNIEAAQAGFELARTLGLGPVMLCSSAAVYGATPGPHREDCRTPDRLGGYGLAKLLMEGAYDEGLPSPPGQRPPTCALRIGNVAGADALFGAMAAGPVTLDRLPDGGAPRRAYVGPLTLARALVALLAAPALPPVLNLAQPGLIGMDDLLRAAGVPFAWRDNPAALPALEMDLGRLHALAPLPPATAESLVAEARLGGWRPWGEAA